MSEQRRQHLVHCLAGTLPETPTRASQPAPLIASPLHALAIMGYCQLYCIEQCIVASYSLTIVSKLTEGARIIALMVNNAHIDTFSGTFVSDSPVSPWM